MKRDLMSSIISLAKKNLDSVINHYGIDRFAREVLPNLKHSERIRPLADAFMQNPDYDHGLQFAIESDKEWWGNRLIKAGGEPLLTERNVLQVLSKNAEEILSCSDETCHDLAEKFVEAGWVLRNHWGEEWAKESGYEDLRTFEREYRACFDTDFFWSSKSEQDQEAARCISGMREAARKFLDKMPVE